MMAATSLTSEAQEALKISGYVQTQWTWNQAEVENGNQNDLTVRRGRLKAQYTNTYGEAVMQVDITENGVAMKDAYLRLQTPQLPWISLRAGVFNRPFGYEISYSSAQRESPERSRVFRTLFPGERDLGAEVRLRGLENTPLNPFTLNAGLFAGNGVNPETDSRKDFIGRIAYAGKWRGLSFGLGSSAYLGAVRSQEGDYVARRYAGFDGQITVKTPLGQTKLNAEYLWGKQPGSATGSGSPTGVVTSDIYLRQFTGYYTQLVQSIGGSNHSIVLKYDTYDPNRKVAGAEVQTVGDIKYRTLGAGWLWEANQNIRFVCYYEMNRNERVVNQAIDQRYATDLKDDLLTVRVQYRF